MPYIGQSLHVDGLDTGHDEQGGDGGLRDVAHLVAEEQHQRDDEEAAEDVGPAGFGARSQVHGRAAQRAAQGQALEQARGQVRHPLTDEVLGRVRVVAIGAEAMESGMATRPLVMPAARSAERFLGSKSRKRLSGMAVVRN